MVQRENLYPARKSEAISPTKAYDLALGHALLSCHPVQALVQPRMMEQVVACKDDIAQQYLMQCVIQCFPDEFHLGTLDALLGTLPQLQPGVKVHVILSSLLDRLAR